MKTYYVCFLLEADAQTLNACMCRILTIFSVLLTHYCAGDKIEKIGMGEACIADRGGKRRVPRFGGETGGKETTGETQA
jgi:hypothetical protein